MNLYIDPGTGSMLFTILIGIITAGVYLLRNLFSKLSFLFSGGAGSKKAQKDRMQFAVFSDSKRYWNTFEPICDEFEKRQQPITYMTSSADDPALEKEYKYVTCQFIGEGNKAFGRLNYLKADVLLSTTPGLDVYNWKRSPDINWYVHVLHASGDPVIYRMFGLDYYDAIIVSGDYHINQLREIEKKRNLPEKELILGGIPYLDRMQKHLDEAEPLQEHPTTVLLAPSWGKSSIFSVYGGKIIDALMETGYDIIIRPHPQSFTSEKDMIEKLMKKYPESEHLKWNRDNDNFEVLRRSDLLISDFSGVILDFALIFQKPIIYADTTFDKSPYDACWLDEELWTFTTLPKIGKQLTEDSLSNIKELIDSVLNDTSFREKLIEIRDETWIPRGNSVDNIVDYMINKRTQLLEEEEKRRTAIEEEARKKKKSRNKKNVQNAE